MLTQTAIEPKELSKRLHPRLRHWFEATYPSFTHAQLLCVPAILDRQSILQTSPTGSGKTLAGFLGVFDFLEAISDFEVSKPAPQLVVDNQ